MFTERAFRSWPQIVVGGLLFAGLFGLAALMTERVFEGAFYVSRWVVTFGTAAFIGYVGIAVLLRLERPPG